MLSNNIDRIDLREDFSSKIKLYDMSDFRITASDAYGLIKNFNDQFSNVGKVNSIGGVIDKNSFIQNGFFNFKGTMCWFGLDSNRFVKLYFEPNVDYYPDNIPFYPKSDNLWSPGFNFSFDEVNLNSEGQLNELILNGFVKSNDRNVGRGECLDDIARFYWEFPKLEFERYNKYSLGFFETQYAQEVVEFLQNEEVEYIAYFFGLNLDDPKYNDNNRIRIILIGMNSNKELLLPENDQSTEQPPYLLQYSWPPKPSGLH